MALLTVNERKAIFKALGLGEYNEKNIKAFQKKYMARKSDVDGKYGVNTDNTLRTVYYVKKYTKNFKPEEFKCECGGRYCCGYPSYMKPAELIHIQAIRDHYGRPITVTCGLRCRTWNSKLGGSIQNSLHLSGQAIDFYQSGVTDTLSNRKASIKWIKKQPNHHYTYGNGINSYGNGVSAPYMGNALHTDTYDNVKPVHPTWTESPSTDATQPSTPIVTPTPQPTPSADKLVVDGIGGKDTIKALQKFLGVTADGVLSGQRKTLSKYYPGITAVEFGKGGSYTVKMMQKWLGIGQDGIWGEGTSKALQKKIGTTADGIFGYGSVKALQTYLNKNDKAVYPEKTKGDKIMDACKAQADYMRNAKYGDYSPVTLAHSKNAGTCVTYEGCVFQRLGLLSSGKYIWQDGKGYGTGKVTHLNNKTMTCTYMGNKMLSSLKSKIQKGDCILLDDNKSGKAGSGGHVFFATGEWSGNDPYIWDFEPNRTCAKTGKPRKYSGKRKVLAIVRPK